MSTDSTFTTEALTRELKEVKDWVGVARESHVPVSVVDTVKSLKNAEKQGPFLIAYLVDTHPIHDWEDMIRGVERVSDGDCQRVAQLKKKYGGGRYGLMSATLATVCVFVCACMRACERVCMRCICVSVYVCVRERECVCVYVMCVHVQNISCCLDTEIIVELL